VPRIVDHDQRRIELAEAVWSLIREQGIQGVTIRQIVARTGWSSGAIRHYLPDRQAILNFAALHVNARAQSRIALVVRTGDVKLDFLNFLHIFLPLDEETRGWMQVWLSFVGLSATDPQMSDAQGFAYTALNTFLKQCFCDLERLGWHTHCAPEAAANELHALLDGLSIHVLLGHISSEQAKEMMKNTLERMLQRPNT
jgi:AcrR family transcriptional regulator